MSILNSIPVGELNFVGWAFDNLHVVRAEILRLREIKGDAHGRHECAYRMSREFSKVKAAYNLLCVFEAMAIANGIDPYAVYAELGGLPEVPGWSPESHAWLLS